MPQPNFHTVRLTAAQDVVLPRGKLWLAMVRVFAGAVPAAFQFRYGSAQALFQAGSNGTRGRRVYRLREFFEGTTLPAAAMTFTGAGAVVELVFSTEEPREGQPLSYYRGCLFRRVDGGPVTGGITVNYDAAPGTPNRIEAYVSASAGRFQFPPVNQLTPQVEAVCTEGEATELPAPPLDAANSLTLTAITDGAATIQAGVYY